MEADRDSPICRICHDGPESGQLFSPCKCSGSIKFVHVECLTKWRFSSKNPQSVFCCENCKYKYNLYRPTLAKLLKSEVVISGVTVSLVSLLTVGSGTGITVISGQKLQLKRAVVYGLISMGAFGVLLNLPTFLGDLLQTHWHKVFDEQFLVPAFIMLLTYGVLSTCIEIYFKVRRTAKRLVKKLGATVLEVKPE